MDLVDNYFGRIMPFLSFFPLFAFMYAGYLFLYLVGFFPEKLSFVIAHVGLPSGFVWRPTWGDLVVLLGLITLNIEVFKATRTSNVSIVDHTLSTLVFIAFLISWMISPWTVGPKGDSTFLFLTLMSFIDVIAGFTITISAARRDFGGS